MSEEALLKKIAKLEEQIKRYEENGPAKLYYALNRKAYEMADLMNDNNLTTLNLDDPKSKTFDRLKSIWQDASTIATAVKAIADSINVTGSEEKDVKIPLIETIAETRK